MTQHIDSPETAPGRLPQSQADAPAVTTTHSSYGSGEPRLVLKSEYLWEGEVQPEFTLRPHETSIGSDASCDVVLPDLAEHHATVLHDPKDEYLVVNHGPEVRVHGAVVTQTAVLRTGARIDLGAHRLTFFREEYADHTRPFGGRVGGEAGHQPSQPPQRSTERRAAS